MSWFSDVFLSLVSFQGEMSLLWTWGLCLLSGLILAGLSGWTRWWQRLLWCLGVYLVLDRLLPENPLFFVDNPRVADFSTAIVLWAFLLVVSVVGLLVSFWRVRLTLLPHAVAGFVVTILSMGQHMLVINGWDHWVRDGHSRHLAEVLRVTDAQGELCKTRLYICEGAVRDEKSVTHLCPFPRDTMALKGHVS